MANSEPTLHVPKGTVDCHVHIFDPARFPYADDRTYTPGPATLTDLQAFLDKFGIERAVLVQPSVYGPDNRCLIDGLRKLGPKKARGIAVIDPEKVSDDELSALQRVGVVGVRVNFSSRGEARAAAAIAAISRTTARVVGFGLLIQIYADLALVASLEETIAAAPVPVVLDHFGGAKANEGLFQPGFDALCRLLASDKLWVKLSAPYRASKQLPDYPDLETIARALIRTNPDRLVWASDWPHTGGGAERREWKASEIEPFRIFDHARALAHLFAWADDAETYKKILVDNAARLFRF